MVWGETLGVSMTWAGVGGATARPQWQSVGAITVQIFPDPMRAYRAARAPSTARSLADRASLAQGETTRARSMILPLISSCSGKWG